MTKNKFCKFCKCYKEYYLYPIYSDNCPEAKEFYKDFWAEIIDKFFSKKDKYGDVIISYYIPTKRYIRCVDKGLEKFENEYWSYGKEAWENLDNMQKYIERSEDIPLIPKLLFKRFYEVSRSRANIMPLIPNGYRSLNPLKGGAAYNEYPDLFYADWRNRKGKVGEYLSVDDPENSKNIEYYEEFGSDFKEFVKRNFLQDFFLDNEYSKFKQLAPPEDKKIMPYPKGREFSDEQIPDFIKYMHDTFLPTAIDIIEKRAELLAKTWRENNPQ